jgi:hypothetical protein
VSAEFKTHLTCFVCFVQDRMVSQIVNRAFGLEAGEEDEKNISKPGSDKCHWCPLDIRAPHILWLIQSHDDAGKRTGSIKDIKGVSEAAYKKIMALSASASILIADIERHWTHETLLKDILKYVTPLSCSAVALSVGFLILIPYALT